jgi:RHS repeat-associated protein
MHVAVTYDRGLGQAKIYVNGVLRDTQNVGTNLMSTAGDFYLGQVPGSANYYAGQLDEISLYQRPLDPEEVYNLFVSGSTGKCPHDLNHPPVVYAGPDFSLASTNTVGTLNGIATDDGLPVGSVLRINWSVFNGPGSVAFANPNSPATTATFSTNGLYVLQLTANDGEAQSSDLVEVRVGIPCVAQDIPGLSAWWPANGTSIDKIGGQSAILGNGTGYTNGEVAAAFGFVPTNFNYVWMPAESNYNVGASAAGFTIEYWMQPTDLQDGSVLGWANGVRFERYGMSGPYVYYAGVALRCYLAGTTTRTQYVDAGGVLGGGPWNWTHVAVTYDRTSGQANMYINGALLDTQNVGTNLLSTAGDFYLGQVPGSSGYFSGQLDEISLFNRPLTSAEIQSIFNAGSTGKCVTPPNQPPFVSAGGDETIHFPTNSVTLFGSAYDDGLPVGSTLTVAWTYLAGTNTVFISSTNTPVTTITFTNTGVYTFQLSASDGQYTATDTATVTVLPDQRPRPVVNITSPADGTLIAVPASGTTSLNLAATVSDTNGRISSVEFFVNGVSVGVSTYVPYSLTDSNLPPGSYTITAVATDNDWLSGTSAPVTAIIYVDNGAPTVAITAPEAGATVTGPTNIIGTVQSLLLRDWNIAVRRLGPVTNDWTVVATGTVAVVNGSLGTLDTTVLRNGVYQIQLQATDLRGRTVETTDVLILDGDMKIGAFTTTFNDITIPAPGLPLIVERNYNSQDPTPGDFGPGWNLELKMVELDKSYPLGEQWANDVYPVDYISNPDPGVIPNYCIDDNGPHIFAIVFPDGLVQRFRAVVRVKSDQSEPCRPVAPWQFFDEFEMSLEALPGSVGTLVAHGLPDPLYLSDSQLGEVLWSDRDVVDDPLGAQFFSDATGYDYTDLNGTTYSFDANGKLLQIQDRNDNTITIDSTGIHHSNGESLTIQRDDSGKITSIQDPQGSSLQYLYDDAGQLIGSVDRAGNTTQYGYDSANQLNSVKDPLGLEQLRMQYDQDRRLREVNFLNNSILRFDNDLAARAEVVTNTLGNTTITYYNSDGTVSRVIDALGDEKRYTYDDFENRTSMTDPLGNVTRMSYDSVTHAVLQIADPQGNILNYTYDTNGNPITMGDAFGNQVTFSRDALGNVTAVTDALGNITSFALDGSGQVIARTNALGQVTCFQYDVQGRMTNSVDALGNATSLTYDANGNELTRSVKRTRADGSVETLTTTKVYDANDRLIQTIDPLGNTNSVAYDAAGRKVAQSDSLGRTTQYQYDDSGWLLKTVYPDGTFTTNAYDIAGRLIIHADVLGNITHFDYDALDRLVKTTYPDGTFSTTTYDAAGRVIATQDPRGYVTSFGYDYCGRRTSVTNTLGQVTRFAYDRNGNKTNMIDELGRSTIFVYDALNCRVKTIFPDGTAKTTQYDNLGRQIAESDQATNTTWFGYDALGNLTSVTNSLGYLTSYAYDELGQQISQTDANHHTTTFEYDSLGRRVKRTLPGNQVETYAYNPAGLLTNKTDFNGYVTTFQYDQMNRLLAKVPDASRGEPTVSYTYNALGLRTGMSDAGGTSTYAYDKRNRLKSKSQRWLLPGGERYTTVLNYAYDENGNLTNILSSDVNGVNVSYGYDVLSRLSAVNDSVNGSTAYGYDGVGNLQSCTYPNLVRSEYQYDSLNRLTNLASSQLLTPIANYAYTVSAAGNRLTASEQLLASSLNAQPKTINRIYTYDNIYRMTGETINGAPSTGSASYNYDPVGNRLSRSVSGLTMLPQTFTFNSNDRLNTDTYDNNGNTLIGAGFGQTQADQYDFENHLVTRRTPSATITIKYDGDGNRVSKTISTATNTVTTCYLVDEMNPSGYAQVLEEYASINSQQPTLNCVYTYGHTLISLDRLVGATWRTSFYGYDGHNNVRYLTDVNGNVTDTYDYDAFGNLTAASGDTVNCYLFTGEQLDLDLGLYYLRARYHNPDTGRFWSQDSFEGDNTDPRSLHKYNYAYNDPANQADPSGMQPTLASLMMNIALSTASAELSGDIGEASARLNYAMSHPNATAAEIDRAGKIGYALYFSADFTMSMSITVACGIPGAVRSAMLFQEAMVTVRSVQAIAETTAFSEEARSTLVAGALEEGLSSSVVETIGEVAQVVVADNKWDYFFGRVTSSPENQARSIQNLEDLKTLGIVESNGGRAQLLKIFDDGLSAPEISREVSEYGISIGRSVQIEDKGLIEVYYFYPKGNLNATPRISTIIPKIF